MPKQPVWFSKNGSDEWKPGFVESKDSTPDFVCFIDDKSSRKLRRKTQEFKAHNRLITLQWPSGKRLVIQDTI